LKENFKIEKYIKNSDFLKTLFKEDDVRIEKIDDGNLNNIFKITSNSDEVIIKQCPNYIIRNDKKIDFPKDRIYFEYFGLKEFKKNMPRNIPEIFYFDEENSLIIMQYLKDYINLENLIRNFTPFDNIISQLSDFIACNLVNNSLDLASNKDDFYKKFNNQEIKTYLQKILFFVNPEIINEKIKNNILELEYKFINQNDTLLHGNLKTDSILVYKSKFFVVDFEACFIGPYSFELSYLISSLIMDYIYCKNIIKNYDYARYLLISLSKILEKFEKSFSKHYLSKNKDDLNFSKIITDAFGYASLHLLQNSIKIRILNKENFQNNQKIELLEYTKHINQIALSILENHKNINNIEDLLVIL
jgi:5-methylthioribose kinase